MDHATKPGSQSIMSVEELTAKSMKHLEFASYFMSQRINRGITLQTCASAINR